MNREHCWNYPAANQSSNDGSEGHSLSLDRLIAFAAKEGKPLAITEAGAGNTSNGGGISDDEDFPLWLAKKLHAVRSTGTKVEFVVLWDADMGGNYEFSNVGNGKPREAAAWAKYFGARE